MLCRSCPDRLKWHSQFLCSQQCDSCLSSSVGGQPTLLPCRWIRTGVWRSEACLVEAKLFQNVQMGSHLLLHVSLCQATPVVSGRSASAAVLDCCQSLLSEGSEPSSQRAVSTEPEVQEKNQRKRHEADESWEGQYSTAPCGGLRTSPLLSRHVWLQDTGPICPWPEHLPGACRLGMPLKSRTSGYEPQC